MAGKGNAQIPVPTSPKNAQIKKQGQPNGTRYGMNSNVKSSDKKGD